MKVCSDVDFYAVLIKVAPRETVHKSVVSN